MIAIDPKGKLVLDANIIVGAIFGTRIRNVLEHPNFRWKIDACCPAVILEEVERKVPEIARNKCTNLDIYQNSLVSLKERITVFSCQHIHKEAARARLASDAGDSNDWQVVALALHLNCGIFSHDKDFWGAGVPVWSIDTVERCLERGGLDL